MRNAARKFGPAALFAASCFAAASAHAQSAPSPITGFYVGAGLGGSKTNVNSGSLASVGFATSGTDDTDTAWNLIAGYKITRTWAVEIGYIDLGTFGANGRFGGAPATINADVTGWNVSAVGTLPLNDMFSLYGKLGYLRSETEATANVAGAIGRGTSRDNGFTAGIGARYHLNRNISFSIEANHYDLGDSGDAQAYMVGARYDF
ncbi:MAG TPA: porin family protein [Burkholderiales bacterium]|jgi:OOP family OmpA-OmpF porin|nr:porin family protein [Burkholderiales bacterium]